MAKKKSAKRKSEKSVGMKIENVPITKLIESAINARTHSAEQVEQIAASITEFGFTNPALIDERGELIAGHGRIMAARTLGLERVPCIRLGHLTPLQVRAYRLADNKIALNSGWDMAKLAAEVDALQKLDVDLLMVGFGDDELAKIIASLALPTAPGQFPAVDENIATEHQCPKCGYKWSGNSAAPATE